LKSDMAGPFNRHYLFLTGVAFARRIWIFWRIFLATLGLITSVVICAFLFRPDLIQWTIDQTAEYFPNIVQPDSVWVIITPTKLSSLDASQKAVVQGLADKYRISPEVIAALLMEAENLAKTTQLDSHLILAVMAIESNFHPFVRSKAGAQGLMQVMPKVHAHRYLKYGGPTAAFDPISNMRVGVSVLVDCIKYRNGSLTEGLIYYFGGGISHDGNGYVQKVLAEKALLDNLAAGKSPRPDPKESE
jgi:Transglycosylase SLT domain